MPDDAEQRFTPGANNTAEPANILGLTVAPLSKSDSEEYDLKQGVQVLTVTDGPASAAGIQPGDIILSVNNKPVENPNEFNALVKELPKSSTVPILVFRDGGSRFIALKLP